MIDIFILLKKTSVRTLTARSGGRSKESFHSLFICQKSVFRNSPIVPTLTIHPFAIVTLVFAGDKACRLRLSGRRPAFL